MHIDVTVGDIAVVLSSITDAVETACRYTLTTRKSPEQLKQEKDYIKTHDIRTKAGNLRVPSKLNRDHKSLLMPMPDGTYCIPVGLWPRIQGILEKSGNEVSVTYRRSSRLYPKPDYSRLSGVSFLTGQQEAIALIAVSSCGIIKCVTGWGKSFVIGKLCKLFPSLRIVVATSSSQVVGSLYERISADCPGEVGYLYTKGNTTEGKRVICCTLKSLAKLNPENVDMLFIDECHSIGDNDAGQTLSRFVFSRKFGFSATPVRNDGSALVMEALLGPIILDVGYVEAVSNDMVVPLNYIMLPCTKGPSFLRDIPGPNGKLYRKDLPEVTRKKFSYWKNDHRNECIAQAVRQILQIDPDIQILIMADTLQHAILLHKLLPNFLVAHYGAADLGDLKSDARFAKMDLTRYKLKPRELDKIRNAFAKGTLKRVISTFVFKQGVDFRDLRIVVRADGRVSTVDGIQIPGRVARTSEGKESGYIIDVYDTQDQWAKARAERREELYKQQGWTKKNIKELLDDIRGISTAGSNAVAGIADIFGNRTENIEGAEQSAADN